MRPLLALAAATALGIACGGSSPTSPSRLPFNPADFSATAFLTRGTLSASVDGRPWQGSPMLYFITGSAGDRFTVFNRPGAPSELSLSVTGPLAVGTYPANRLEIPAMFILAQPPVLWAVNPADPGSTGSLTVTIASRTRVAGTFAFTGVPGGTGQGAAPRVVTNGVFDVSQ